MPRRNAVYGLVIAAAVMPALVPSAAGAATTAWLQNTTEMHAGPDYDYPTIDVIYAGDGVVVHGCLADWSWCDVGYRGDRGWVDAVNLLGEWESGRAPIIYAGPRMGLGILSFSFTTYWDSNYRHRDFYRERSRWHNYARTHYRDHDHRPGGRLDHRDRNHRNGDRRHDDHRDDNRRGNDKERWRNERQNSYRPHVQQEQVRRDQAQKQQARQERARQDQTRQRNGPSRKDSVRETNDQRQLQQRQLQQQRAQQNQRQQHRQEQRQERRKRDEN